VSQASVIGNNEHHGHMMMLRAAGWRGSFSVIDSIPTGVSCVIYFISRLCGTGAKRAIFAISRSAATKTYIPMAKTKIALNNNPSRELINSPSRHQAASKMSPNKDKPRIGVRKISEVFEQQVHC
jgi:hypothetical protein